MVAPTKLIPLLLLAGSLSLSAQESTLVEAPVEAPGEGSNLEIGEAIDVRVVNVEAVVTDRRGGHVAGLTPADFRLLIDGEEVPVDYFTEIRGGTAMAAGGEGVHPPSPVEGVVGRNLLVFIDQAYTIQAQLDLVLRQLQGDLDRLGPEDRIAVVAANPEGGLDILTDWTSDVGRLRSVFEQARTQPTGGARLRSSLDSMENDRVLVNLATTNNVWGNSPALGHVEVGDWWDLQPSARPRWLSSLEYFSSRYDDRKGEDSFGTAAIASLRAFSSAPGRKAMLLLSGGWPGGGDARVIEAANLLGYSLYPVDVSGIQTNPVPMSASQFGLGETGVNTEYSGFITSPWERRVDSGFQILARETGGKASLNGNRESALERTLADTSSYYWIGFSPSWKADGRKHDIRLEVRRRGLDVRARRGYTDLSQRAQQALETESRRVIAASGSGAR